MSENKNDVFSRSFSYFQNIVKQSGPAASASYTLVGSIIMLGLLGYFLDDLFQTKPWLLLLGLLIGLATGFYELVKAIWKK